MLPVSMTLGEYRGRTLASRQMTVRGTPDPAHAAPLDAPLPPTASWLQMLYPFTTNVDVLRHMYGLFDTDSPRIGLLLEDLDGFAADVAYRHIRHSGVRIVTASVDHIDWLGTAEGPLSLAEDLRMSGQVTWVGRASMEVSVEVDTVRPGATWQHVGVARLVMVAVAPSGLEAAPRVRPLEVLTPGQEALVAAAAARQAARRRDRSLGPEASLPTRAELMHIYTCQARLAGGPALRVVPISSTVQHNTLLTHSQDRNMNGFIFGGHLMRQLFELAWATATLHAEGEVRATSIADINFLEPVPIGAILACSAMVIHTQGDRMLVSVQAKQLQAGCATFKLTNNVLVKFAALRGTALTQVAPITLRDAQLFVRGMRQPPDHLDGVTLASRL